MHGALLLLLLALIQDQELPGFEKGSYVVSAPNAYDKTKKYPLILDLHGAISPAKKGANITASRVWKRFATEADCIVAGPNGRTRAWGMLKDENEYILAVLKAVRAKYNIDPERIYLAGFSSGSDYLCKSDIQSKGPFKASLVICPGPPNVVGLRGGELVAKKDHVFLFATGEEDYIRKDGAWKAFVALDKAGGNTAYREVPEKAHEFFGLDEYKRLFRRLEKMAGGKQKEEAPSKEKGKALLGEAAKIEDLGESIEAYWRIATRYYRIPEIAEKARAKFEELTKDRKQYRARRDYFRNRRKGSYWKFDRYLNYRELTVRLKHLSEEYPVHLNSMGKSIEGRDLWVLQIGPDDRPAVYVQGGIHGNEASSVMTTLYFAWQLAANPSNRRSIRRILQRYTIYIAPAVNPDAVHHYLTEPHSHWRPRFNYRPHDSDKDGKVDEDPYEDLDGDGEIAQMYRPDPDGPFILKDGKLVRGSGEKRYSHVGREGIDNDGDGKYSEDPPGGVNLNRNFPVGFKVRRDFEGHRGAEAASEPETKAIMKFVKAHPNIALFLDYHNDGKCMFFWKPGPDAKHYDAMAARAEKRLGYPPKPLDHAGAGLSIAWAYGEMGILSFIVELDTPERDDLFIPAKPFKHPQLGEILLGNDYKKLHKRNPEDILSLAEKNWDWLRGEIQRLPRLELVDPVVTKTESGFEVTGVIRNAGELPLGPSPITSSGEGRIELNKPFTVKLPAEDSVTLVIRHARVVLRFPVARKRSRTISIRKKYEVAEGYVTPDKVESIVLKEDKGPAFEVKHRGGELKIAVLLGEWKDRKHRFPPAFFRKAFFSKEEYTDLAPTGTPVYGSVRDFYHEASYGKLTVTGKVFDWVEMPGQYADYRDASFGSSIVSDRLIEAVGKEKLKGYHGVVFIWAGNSVKRTSALWPMRIKVKALPDVVAFKMGEMHRGEFSVGVPCHEMGHTFGVNDKYGLGATKNPLGPWCLMGKGTHGAEPSGRHRPFHMCAWCRMVIGWVKPAVIDATPRKLALRPVLFGPGEAFRILLKPDGSEYLLLENRRKEGFFTDISDPGLGVLHVAPHKSGFAQKAVQLLRPADSLKVSGVTLSRIRVKDDVVYFEVK